MDDLNFIKELYIPIVLVACLCVGYVIKNFMPTDNKYIPLFMLILGAVLGCVANQSIDLQSIVSGGVTGLASTGLHQVFKQLLKLPMGEDEYYSMGDDGIPEGFEDFEEIELEGSDSTLDEEFYQE